MWKKLGNSNILEEFILEKQKMTIGEFINDNRFYTIKRLNEIANKLIEASKTKQIVTIVGDYDSDGINSLMEMALTCIALRINYRIIIPKRFSEGYGLSEKIIDRIDANSILITIDNGIAAIESIKKAKEKNIYVIIMDHHIASVDEFGNIVLPDADIIVDPEALEGSAEFQNYCGAGLAFKLAQLLIQTSHPFYTKIASFAAIGTIGDVVSLTGDNRKIVKEGMKYLASGPQTKGLFELMQSCKITEYSTSTDYAFKLIPCINAPGRLEDDGGKKVIKTLLCEDEEIAKKYTEELISLNKKRQEIVEQHMLLIDKSYVDNNESFICYYGENIPEGIIGIIAGKLAEKTGKCTFIFTQTEEGILKGSARSKSKDINIKNFLDAHKDLLLKFGGHKKAAGLSMSIKNFMSFKNAMKVEFAEIKIDNILYYDLEIDESDVLKNSILLESLEPFGEGNPKPIYRIKAKMGDKFGNTVKIMGENKNHIKFCFKEFDALAFKMADQYEKEPFEEIDMIGTIEKNVWNGKERIQLSIIDFRKK